MRYKVGAEQLQPAPSLVHRPNTVFQVGRTAPVGPTHAVCAATGATLCGVKAEGLEVLEEDWEAACFVEKCPACFAAAVTRAGGGSEARRHAGPARPPGPAAGTSERPRGRNRKR
jgi:hypothetical protein